MQLPRGRRPRTGRRCPLPAPAAGKIQLCVHAAQRPAAACDRRLLQGRKWTACCALHKPTPWVGGQGASQQPRCRTSHLIRGERTLCLLSAGILVEEGAEAVVAHVVGRFTGLQGDVARLWRGPDLTAGSNHVQRHAGSVVGSAARPSRAAQQEQRTPAGSRSRVWHPTAGAGVASWTAHAAQARRGIHGGADQAADAPVHCTCHHALDEGGKGGGGEGEARRAQVDVASKSEHGTSAVAALACIANACRAGDRRAAQ